MPWRQLLRNSRNIIFHLNLGQLHNLQGLTPLLTLGFNRCIQAGRQTCSMRGALQVQPPLFGTCLQTKPSSATSIFIIGQGLKAAAVFVQTIG